MWKGYCNSYLRNIISWCIPDLYIYLQDKDSFILLFQETKGKSEILSCEEDPLQKFHPVLNNLIKLKWHIFAIHKAFPFYRCEFTVHVNSNLLFRSETFRFQKLKNIVVKIVSLLLIVACFRIYLILCKILLGKFKCWLVAKTNI